MEAARCGSFTETAARLRMSIAAISRSIARLEAEVDARLFNRTTRRLNLTADGQSFLAEISEGLEKLNAAKDRLHEGHHRVSGTLKVLLPNSFCKHYMMPDLPDFLAAHPDLHLDMHVEDYAVDLLDGGFEVAVQYGQPPTTGYISRALGAMHIVLVASPAYLARRGVPRCIADLDGHERISLRASSGATPFMWTLERVAEGPDKGEHILHRPNGRCFVNSQLDASIHAAVCGVGITPTDIVAVRRYLESGELRIVLPDFAIPYGGELFLLYPHRDHLPLRVRSFIDFLIQVSRERLPCGDFNPARFAA